METGEIEMYIEEKKTKKQTGFLPVVMMLSAAVLWSTGGMMIKQLSLNPMVIAGYRSLIAAIVVSLFLQKPTFHFSWNKLLGAISYASMMILCVSATKKTTAASAILLQYTAPIYIAILGGRLLKEKAESKDWFVILFVLAGMVLLFLDDRSTGSLKGNLMGALSGVAMAMNTIFMRREKDADPLENVFWGCVLTVLITLPSMVRSVPNENSWIGLILLGIFQLGFSYVLYARAIRKISALQSAFICLIEPLLNPVWVFLTVGEFPGALSVLGGLIILTAVTVGCIRSKKRLESEAFQQQNS